MPACLPGEETSVMCACGAVRTLHRGDLASDDGRRVIGHYVAVYAEHLRGVRCGQPDHHITVLLSDPPACCATVTVHAAEGQSEPATTLAGALAVAHEPWAGRVVTNPGDPRAGLLLAGARAVLDGDDRVRETLGLPRRRSRLTLDPEQPEPATWTCPYCTGLHHRAVGFVYENDLPRAAYAFCWIKVPTSRRERFAVVEVGLGDYTRPEPRGERIVFSARVLHTHDGIGYALTDPAPGASAEFGRTLSAAQARVHPDLDLVWRVVDLASEQDPRVVHCRDWMLDHPGR